MKNNPVILLYSIFTKAYYLLIRLAVPFNTRASLMINGRKGQFEKIASALKENKKELLWFHAASLGEFEQARPIIEQIDRNRFCMVLTFFSSSGYQVRKNYSGVDHVFYLPFDTRKNASEFLNLIHPFAVFFVKYEFWFFYLNQLSSLGIHAFLISAAIKKETLQTFLYGSLLKEMLKKFTFIFTQFKENENMLKAEGIKNVLHVGDTRYDRVSENVMKVASLPLIQKFRNDKFLLVAGSSYHQEEELVFEFLKVNQDARAVIAPHEVTKSRLREIESRFKSISTISYSMAEAAGISNQRILIIDNVGMLSSVYRYASLALVGGGFGTKGLHNILEPCAFGIPVAFGKKNISGFHEANEMIKAGAALGIDMNDISQFTSLPNERSICEKMGEAALKFIEIKKGATVRIINHSSLIFLRSGKNS